MLNKPSFGLEFCVSQQHRSPLGDVINAAKVAVSAQGPRGNPAWTPSGDPHRCHGHPWVQSCAQILVQNAPQRTFSRDSCNTSSFSRESKHKRLAQGPASEKPARRLTNVVQVQHLFPLSSRVPHSNTATKQTGLL